MRSIRTQFLVLVSLFAVAYAVFVVVRTSHATRKQVNAVTEHQAELALAFELAIREYVAEAIRPFAEAHLPQDEFVPEIMSTSFVARQVFEKVRERFPDYVLKFSSEDPRNPVNIASEEEARVIEYFRVNPSEEEWSGPITIAGREYLGHFSARRMVDSCLRCHGEPADAPASLVERYGDKASFHRKPGDVVALDSVAIPVAGGAAGASVTTDLVSGVVAVAILFAGVFLVFQFVVARRLAWLSERFEGAVDDTGRVALDPVAVKGRDEISRLVMSFNHMAGRLRELHDDLEGRVRRRTAQLERQVAERHRAQEAVRESEARYRAVIGGFDGFIVVCDEQGVVQYANARCVEWLGEDPVGKTAAAAAPLFAVARGELEEGVVPEGKHIELRDPSSQRWYDAVASTIDRGDGQRLRQTMFFDITARREAEEAQERLSEELRHAQKMDAIGQLAGGIAHDFNNILTAIRGNAELLALGDDPKEREEYAQDIVSAASRAADLTQQLLTFARKAGTRFVGADVGQLVEEVVELLRRSIDRRIDIEVSLGAEESIVTGDPAQLQHALLNLGVNARDAMPGGGTLRFRTRSRWVGEDELGQHPTLRKAGNYIEVEVSDTGCGISESIIERIFDPFFTTKEPGHGTGLGLASVYGCVQSHAGEVTVDSREGVGTTFRLLLPLGRPQVVMETDSAAEAPQPGKGRILIADDEESVRKLAARVLERLGYTVTTCVDGREALERYEESDGGYDLVILDMTMPRMNGHETFVALRERNPAVRAIVASGYMTEEVRQLLEEEGISGVIAKPYRLNDLSRVVAQHMTH